MPRRDCLTAERTLPPGSYGTDYPLLRTSPLARRVLQLVEVLCAEGASRREVDAEEIYSSLLTEFALQKQFPIHIEEALDTLHRRGFITLSPQDSGADMSCKISSRLRPLPKYRLNSHHRSDLHSAAVLCLNLQEEPLHIFRNLADIAHTIHLRPENVLKVCLKSNLHDEEHEDNNKWPRSHSNLIFKWADEMTLDEKEELARLRREDAVLDSYGAWGCTDPVDRIHRSLEAWCSRGPSSRLPDPSLSDDIQPRVISKRPHIPSLKVLEQHEVMDSRTQSPSRGEPAHRVNTRVTRSVSPAVKSDDTSWRQEVMSQEQETEEWEGLQPPPLLRRSLSINSHYNDERRDSLDNVPNNSTHRGSGGDYQLTYDRGYASRTYSSSLRAYCERHGVSEESVQLDLPALMPVPPTCSHTTSSDSACIAHPVSHSSSCHSTHPSPRQEKHFTSTSPRVRPPFSPPSALPFDHQLVAHKRKWSLSPQDLQCFANSSSSSCAVLRTWDDAISLASGRHEEAAGVIESALGAFLEHAKKLLCGVGSILRAKLFNEETKTFESKVVVVVSTNGDTTHLTDAFRLKVYSGTLPLHTISLKECPLETEDELWECWCGYFSDRCGGGAGGDSLMDAMKRCVQRVQERSTRCRWYATQVECVLPWLMKRHSRSAIFLTAEPNLIRTLRALQPSHPAKTMTDLVRLYYLISDPRGREDLRDKDRKDQYRCVFRVFMCADFLLGGSVQPPGGGGEDFVQPARHIPEDEVAEWLSIYSAYSFADLF